MKKIIRSLLAFAVAAVCLVTPQKAQAGSYYTVTVKDMSGYKITAFQVYQGDSILETFYWHPEYLKAINQQDDTRMPTFYKNQSFTVYDPNEPVMSDRTLFITYSKAINSIKLGLTWPSAGESAVYPDIYSLDSSPKYSVSSARWLKEPDDTTAYTGKFAENQVYWADLQIFPYEMYGLNYYNETLKVKINGIDASYTKNTVPNEGIRIIFEVKIDDKVEAFVRRMYVLCLGRQPDPSGFTSWVSKLKNKTKKASDIVYGFFNSAEFKNKAYDNDEFLKLCYRVMMDRGADAGGVKYWDNQLKNGVSRNYVLKGFLDSQEFHALCKKYGIEPGTITLSEARDKNPGLTAFIVRLYMCALDRYFDTAGVNYWCEQVLSKKKTPKEVAMSFFSSAEFNNRNLGNTDFVKVLYRTFMNREADSGGLAYWVKKLEDGASRNSVVAGFADSKEFANILKSYGL